MDQILEVRSNIYDQFHGSNAGQVYFFKDDHAEAYAAYYTAMYLIQDTGESVLSHMECGFSSDPWLADIEFWGVMQAIVIQQDAIKELYEAVIGSKLQIAEDSDWSKIRDVRNLCAGHPAKRASESRLLSAHSWAVTSVTITKFNTSFGTRVLPTNRRTSRSILAQ